MSVLIPSGPARLRLSMPCALENVRPLAKAARDFLVGHQVLEEDVMACELCLGEACNNAVLYAEGEGRVQGVEVEIVCDSAKIQLRVEDHTAGFEVPENISLPSPESEGGRGLFIMKSMMDNVHYFPGQSKNSLVLTRLRQDPSPDDRKISAATLTEFTHRLAESEQIISDMAEELSSCYEALSAIFRCGAELGKTNNLPEFSRALCHDLLQITGSDWYVLRIVRVEDGHLAVFSASETAADLKPISISNLNDRPEAEARAVAARYDIWFGADKPLHPNDPLSEIYPGAIGMVHPFLFADGLLGTLTVGKAPGKASFTAAHANVINTFADFLAIQVVNTRLQEEQLKSRLISHELEIAKTIQHALLPKTLPSSARVHLAGFCESAREVGGDFYDVLAVNDSSMMLVIADVMGKGVPAAMFAAILRSVLRAAPEYNRQPAALLSRVNKLLYSELSEVEMFITAQLVCVDFKERKLTVAGAGHCPLLLAAPTLPFVRVISADGIPLGIMPDAIFKDQSEELLPDSRVILYTDGLTDAQDSAGNFFGEQRLLSWFQQGVAERRTADELKSSLADELKKFQGSAAQYDDQTFLILAEEETERRIHAGENFISR